MTLTMDDLGAIGDFVSGIGVVVSLLYLARQLRQANRAHEAATTNAVSSFFAGLLVQIGENRELCAALLRQGRGEELDPVARTQVVFVLRGQLVAFENYYRQFLLGYMDRPGWESRRGIVLEILANPEARALWDRTLAREQHPGFAKEIGAALELRDRARAAADERMPGAG
jgi:hypothetical protein